MKNRQPYPFMSAKNIDSYLDGILAAYLRDIDAVGNRIETLFNVVGEIPEMTGGAVETIISASGVFAETGKTVLLIAFEASGKFVAEIPDAAGKTAFFVSSVLEKPLTVAEDITIEDVWKWIKAINRINLLSPEFIPDDIRDNNPARVLQIPVDGSIDYDFHNVTDVERPDLPSIMPSTRLYPGSIIDYTPYGIAGKALITCVHTQTQEVIEKTPEYYQYNENLWDLSDALEPVPFISPYSPVSPLVSDIKSGGIRCFWIDYAKREMIIQDSIRVFKRETLQNNGNEFFQSFLHWEKRLYTPSSVLYTTDFKPSDTGYQDTSSTTVAESTIERTYGLMCHGVFLPDRFYSTFKPKKAAFPFLPLIFAGALMFYPHVVNGVLGIIAGISTTIRTNEGKENE